MSFESLKYTVDTLENVNELLEKIPSNARFLFFWSRVVAKRKADERGMVEFILKEIAGSGEKIPFLLKILKHYRFQLLPFMMSYEQRYLSVFEKLFSLQNRWFSGWRKFDYQRDFAILYADMVGFSERCKRHNFYAAIDILLYRYVFFRILKDHRGCVEASGGDSILSVLEDVGSAVKVAKNIIRRCKSLNIGVRIGISFGDYISDEEGRPIIGASINTATRVADAGSKGIATSGYGRVWEWVGTNNTYPWREINGLSDIKWGIWLSWNAVRELRKDNRNPIQRLRELLSGEDYTLYLYQVPLKGVRDGRAVPECDIQKYFSSVPAKYRMVQKRNTFLGISFDA